MYTKNQNHRWYKSWIQSETENQNFEKMKKTPRDTIILHECTKDHDHMLGILILILIFSFWAIFTLLPP